MSPIETVPDRPLDRAESELFRVVLSNPAGMEIEDSDFADPRLKSAFIAIAPQLASLPPGTPIDPSQVEDETLRSLIRALSLEDRPLPDWNEMKTRVRLRRIDGEIDQVEADLAKMEEGSETYSESLRRLIALQQEKHSLGR